MFAEEEGFLAAAFSVDTSGKNSTVTGKLVSVQWQTLGQEGASNPDPFSSLLQKQVSNGETRAFSLASLTLIHLL